MAQDKLPVPDQPQSWVNDYAGVFSSSEVLPLDQKLNEFEYRSSTQIFIVTLDDNGGYPASDAELPESVNNGVWASRVRTTACWC